MFRFAAAFPAVLLATVLAAQQVPAQRTLDDLRQAFRGQWEQLHGDGRPNRDQEHQLLQRQADELRQFVQHEAKADDRWNARVMLAELRGMGLGDRDGALAVLGEIDAKEAPPLVLMTAADMANLLEDKPLRDRLVTAALAKEAPLEQQLAMARLLLTTLHEVERGEKLFADALAAQQDDEQRALVRWHRADALRDREDVADASKLYYAALDQLAKDLPQTYWGGIAKDRVKASLLEPGSEAIPFTAKTVGGETLSLDKLRGKAVLLLFWASDDPAAERLAAELQQLQQTFGEQLQVVGIARDLDAQALQQRCQKLGANWPEICTGKGFQSDLFLRYQVETVPTILVLDKEGRITGMNLHTGTKDAVRDLQDAVRKAVGGG